MLLLQNNADLYSTNGERRFPKDMTKSSDNGREILKLLLAAERTEIHRKELKLLSAAREGKIAELKKLVRTTISIYCYKYLYFDVEMSDIFILIRS